MECFFDYWAPYWPHSFAAAQDFIRQHSQLMHYRKQQSIKLPDETFPYFCIVLEGLVGGYELGRQGMLALRELIRPMDFFTGTAHTFTLRPRPIEYRALEKTRLLCIPIAAAQTGQQGFSEIGELFHILKQRKIDFLRNLLIVYQETTAYARYCTYAALLPQLCYQIPHTIQAQLLHMSRPTYHRVKARYLRR